MAIILLIDDDADLSDFLRAELEAHGHGVVCLDRGERGPDVLAQTAFDLVLLDNKMPGMTGIEFLAALQERGLDVPVILMTGYATTDTAIQAINLGAFDYVIKPHDFATLYRELEPVVEEALALRRPAEEVRLPGEAPPDAPQLVGQSLPMLEVCKKIGRFAGSLDPVLIRGETGTGKELVARAIHTYSPRKARPFVALNMASQNETLLDDELFGHEAGAFTGADRVRKGKFEHAHGGTLFLDEIGDMPLPLQAKLLRVIEYQEVCRIGSNDVIKVNVRLLSATHCDLEAAIRDGKFRLDLFHRLNRLPIRLPPLRERLADLPELAAYCLARASRSTGRPAPRLSEAALERLRTYRWPGNVRELDGVLRRAAAVCRGPEILPAHLDLPAEAGSPRPRPAEDAGHEEALTGLRRAVAWALDTGQKDAWPLLHDLLERELLASALDRFSGNQTEVAERLGMARNTVIKRTQKYGLK